MKNIGFLVSICLLFSACDGSFDLSKKERLLVRQTIKNLEINENKRIIPFKRIMAAAKINLLGRKVRKNDCAEEKIMYPIYLRKCSIDSLIEAQRQVWQKTSRCSYKEVLDFTEKYKKYLRKIDSKPNPKLLQTKTIDELTKHWKYSNKAIETWKLEVYLAELELLTQEKAKEVMSSKIPLYCGFWRRSIPFTQHFDTLCSQQNDKNEAINGLAYQAIFSLKKEKEPIFLPVNHYVFKPQFSKTHLQEEYQIHEVSLEVWEKNEPKPHQVRIKIPFCLRKDRKQKGTVLAKNSMYNGKIHPFYSYLIR